MNINQNKDQETIDLKKEKLSLVCCTMYGLVFINLENIHQFVLFSAI